MQRAQASPTFPSVHRTLLTEPASPILFTTPSQPSTRTITAACPPSNSPTQPLPPIHRRLAQPSILHSKGVHLHGLLSTPPFFLRRDGSSSRAGVSSSCPPLPQPHPPILLPESGLARNLRSRADSRGWRGTCDPAPTLERKIPTAMLN
jgi:hypothetical protein